MRRSGTGRSSDYEHRRRSHTSPANLLATAAIPVDDLAPPKTPEIVRQFAEGGSTTTLLDIALGIVSRLAQVPENDLEELDFLQACLKAGHAKTTIPCALLDVKHHKDEVQDYVLKMCGDTPSEKSVASGMTRSATHRLFQDDDAQAGPGPVPAWPGASLDRGAAQELGALLEQEFDTWSFDTFRLSQITHGRPLQFAGWAALRRHNFFPDFCVNQDKAQRFFQRVESKYATEKAVMYHNNLHGADVTQSVHALLGDAGLAAYFDDLSCLTLVLSASIHDMGHDGRNNNFHVNAQDHFALTYNDQSVLENFHVSQAFKLLSSEPEADVLSGLQLEQRRSARKQMIEAVLGTDMAHHFSKLGNFKNLAQRLECDPDAWCEEPEAMSVLRSMALHACDISNPGKPLELSDRWADLLRSEFYLQGDEEKRLMMNVSPLCDRETVKFASSQIGFIEFIVRPTFDAFAELTPAVEELILARLDEGLDVWTARKREEEEAAQAPGKAA